MIEDNLSDQGSVVTNLDQRFMRMTEFHTALKEIGGTIFITWFLFIVNHNSSNIDA